MKLFIRLSSHSNITCTTSVHTNITQFINWGCVKSMEMLPPELSPERRSPNQSSSLVAPASGKPSSTISSFNSDLKYQIDLSLISSLFFKRQLNFVHLDLPSSWISSSTSSSFMEYHQKALIQQNYFTITNDHNQN